MKRLFVVRATGRPDTPRASGIAAGARFYVRKMHRSRAAALMDARVMNLALRSNDPVIRKIRDGLAALTG
jgi:hypothetical protein